MLDTSLCIMHSLCMATKTISLRVEAYEKLRQARRYAGESFSEVVLRAKWPDETITGAQLLERVREHGPFFTEEGLNQIERMKAEDQPPKDKWRRD